MIGIVYNPSKNLKALDKAVRAFKARDLPLQMVATKNFEDIAIQVNRFSNDERIDLLVIGGGDGTILAAINGLASFNKPVGILPLGCSNDFCHALGIITIDDAIQAVINGHSKKVDLGIAAYRGSDGAEKTMYFCSTAGIGFIPAILKIENKRVVIFFKKLVKDGIWAVLAFYKIIFAKDVPVKLFVNQQEVYSQKTRLLEVSKVKKAGGVPFTPDAELTNRSLDFWFAREMSFLKFFYSVVLKVTLPQFKIMEQVTYFSLGPMRSHDHAPVHHIRIQGDQQMPMHLNGEYIGEYADISFNLCSNNQLMVLHNA